MDFLTWLGSMWIDQPTVWSEFLALFPLKLLLMVPWKITACSLRLNGSLRLFPKHFKLKWPGYIRECLHGYLSKITKSKQRLRLLLECSSGCSFCLLAKAFSATVIASKWERNVVPPPRWDRARRDEEWADCIVETNTTGHMISLSQNALPI